MKIICSWCKKMMGEKELFEDTSETHAKCAECLDIQRQKKNENKNVQNIS